MRDEVNPRVELTQRTKQFALRIIKLSTALGNDEVARVIKRQLLRSGTSVGAQIREAKRARSDAEFVSKVESALQELEETVYWLELIEEASLMSAVRLVELQREADELTAIFVTCVKNVKAR